MLDKKMKLIYSHFSSYAEPLYSSFIDFSEANSSLENSSAICVLTLCIAPTTGLNIPGSLLCRMLHAWDFKCH